MDAKPKVKQEAKAAPAFKPKFTPKVPSVKPEASSAGEAKSVPGSSTSETVGEGNASGRRGKDRGGDRGAGRGRGRGGRGPGRGGRGPGGGRGQFVMPVGQDFFTGNSAGGSKGFRPAAMAVSRNAAVLPMAGSNSSSRDASGPSEYMEARSSAGVHFAPTAGKASTSGEYDSDEEDCPPADESREEDWPPANYSPAAPLSLPFGPKSKAMRERLANAPILANPQDIEGLRFEQDAALFLMQMPTALKLNGGQGSAAEPISLVASAGYKPGKIGKVQLMRSGKVRIITNDGKKFEVNPGIAVAFAQYLANVDVDTDSADSGASSSSSSRDVKPGKESKEKKPNVLAGAAAVAASGDIHLLGRITRKLVVTPLDDESLENARKISSSAVAGLELGVNTEGIEPIVVDA